uniref:MHC class II beta chain transcript 5 n=1 Tax=Lissotriton vulgaris TaxID=8324 RepID=A0A6M9U0B8_LISVU|nr:MHC class II beta chain precursor transcript 5 [Lissotriton vulgaris]
MVRPSLPRGALMAMLALLGSCAPLCRASPDDFVLQNKGECHLVNGSQRVRYLDRYIYNRQQVVHFDSDVGYFVADMEAGEPSAKQWNSDPAILERERAEVEGFCRHNYEIFEGFMEQRRQLETSESARSKMMTGVVGFVLGGIFFTVGLIIYLKNKKGSRQFISYQPEEVDIMNN